MCHLHGGVVIEGGFACYHASKQHHVHRGVFCQGSFVRLFILFSFADQRGKCGRLTIAHEKQRVRALFGIFFLDVQPCVGQRLDCKLLRVVPGRPLCDFLGDHIHNFLGAFAWIICRWLISKIIPNRLLPCLTGHSGACDAAIDGSFGAACVITVHAARRNGLQNMNVDVKIVAHCFSSSDLRSMGQFRWKSSAHPSLIRSVPCGVCHR